MYTESFRVALMNAVEISSPRNPHLLPWDVAYDSSALTVDSLHTGA